MKAHVNNTGKRTTRGNYKVLQGLAILFHSFYDLHNTLVHKDLNKQQFFAEVSMDLTKFRSTELNIKQSFLAQISKD